MKPYPEAVKCFIGQHPQCSGVVIVSVQDVTRTYREMWSVLWCSEDADKWTARTASFCIKPENRLDSLPSQMLRSLPINSHHLNFWCCSMYFLLDHGTALEHKLFSSYKAQGSSCSSCFLPSFHSLFLTNTVGNAVTKAVLTAKTQQQVMDCFCKWVNALDAVLGHFCASPISTIFQSKLVQTVKCTTSVTNQAS